MEVELTAAIAMLDERHSKLPQVFDQNGYELGSIAGHNIVIAGMPATGNATAAVVVTQLKMTYPNIRYGLLVGIGGGVPVETTSGMIRLGDVVVSMPTGVHSGVVQYDRGKADKGRFERTGALAPPPQALLAAANLAKSERAFAEIGDDPIAKNIALIDTTKIGLRRYQFPGINSDCLFPPSYHHITPRKSCVEGGCDLNGVVLRHQGELVVAGEIPYIQIHRGTIACSEHVLKDGSQRDKWHAAHGVLCFETEAAGTLSGSIGYLVIRGISDYCDSHKNDEWHGFAAASAAAYARQLFFHMPLGGISRSGFLDHSMLRTIVDRSDDTEREKIISWISSTDYADVLTDELRKRVKGTGSWLLESNQFRKWVMEGGSVLYCPGIPGAGKTMMASIILDHLGQIFEDKDVSIAYIFGHYKKEQTVPNIMATILRQLVESLPAIPDELHRLYRPRHRGNQLRLQLREDEITKCLMAVCKIRLRVYIVVDALDECSESARTRNDIISCLLRLRAECGINLLVTSTQIPGLSSRFEKFPNLKITASQSDITSYINDRMQDLPEWVDDYPELRVDISSKVGSSVNGMFLLAKLHMDSFKDKVNPNQMKAILGQIQDGIWPYSSAYAKAMGRIEQQSNDEAQLAKKLISWIIFAFRPLTLTELHQALAVKQMLSVCAGLITYNERNHIVELVHRTTKEFFENEGLEFLSASHREIGEACIRYLSYDAFASGPCLTEEHFEERCRNYPLYNYAARKWGYHARKQPRDYSLVLALLKSDKKVSSCGQAFLWESGVFKEFEEVPREVTGLQMAVEFGLDIETEEMLGEDPSPSCLANYLFKAVNQGYSSLIEILLAKGGRLTHVDENGRTALSIAAQQGHESIVALLLQKKMNTNGFDKEGHSALSRASENGHLGVVKLLLDEGADVEPIMRSDIPTSVDPLTIAVFNGHAHVVDFLHKRGSSLEKEALQVDRDNREMDTRISLLMLAIGFGHTEVVELLLEHGMSPHERDSAGNTPLGTAAQEGYAEIVRLLLYYGAEANEPSQLGLRPLELATVFRNLDAMEVLLKYNADPNLYFQYSLLFLAVEKDDVEVLNLLLEYNAQDLPDKRADIDTVPFKLDDDAPLSKELPGGPEMGAPRMPVNAAWSLGGNEEIIKVLIRHGLRPCSIKSLDDSLLWAAKYGSVELVKVLLDEGADINATSAMGSTPLLLAAKSARNLSNIRRGKPGDVDNRIVISETGSVDYLGGTPNAVKGSGADPGILLATTESAKLEARDRNGLTALSISAAVGNIDLVKKLVENGANKSSRDELGRTALHHAYELGQEDVAEFLLSEDPSLILNFDDFGRSAALLRVAPSSAGSDRHKVLNENQADLQRVLRTICSPVYDLSGDRTKLLFLWAAERGHIELVKAMIGGGVSHSLEDELGNTAFTLAIRNARLPVIEFLLQAGSSPSKRNKSGFTPLWSAFKSGDQETIMSVLSGKGVNPHISMRPTMNYRAFDLDTYPPLLWAVTKGFEKVVDQLLKMTNDPQPLLYPKETEGSCVLIKAVICGYYNIVETLLSYDIDLDSCHKALKYAMEFQDAEIVSLIISDMGIGNRWMVIQHGREILLTAAYFGFHDVVRALLVAGMDPETRVPANGFQISEYRRNERDPSQQPGFSSFPLHDDCSAIDLAAQKGHSQVIQALLERMTNPDTKSPLRHAINGGHVPVIEILLNCGGNLSLKADGSSILLSAARKGHTEFVIFLLDKISKGVFQLPAAEEDFHPLLEAVWFKHYDTVQAFLDNKVDANTTDGLGRSGLIIAAQTAQLDMDTVAM
ncbi:ankyrin repeat-containing domain protein [Penicillium verhagenii]|nr:ankyrin repeat-containing domain protein [Penicillium verhagenii]